MKPLQVIQRVLMWFGGVPPYETDSKREKVQYITLTAIIMMVHVVAVFSGATFIYRHVSVDLEQTLFALFHTIGCFSTLYQSIATVLLRRKLFAIIESLTNIYNENKKCDWFYLLKQINEKCEWMWPFYKKYYMGGYVVSTVTFAAVSALFTFIAYGQFEAKHAYHPYKLIFPGNQSTLLGYSLETSTSITCYEAYFTTNGYFLLLFISMCLHHQTFYQIFRKEASKLDYRDNHRNVAEHLGKMIRFHISVKDWFIDSADVYSPIILVVLISSMLYLACSIFQLDLLMKHPNFNLYVICLGVLNGLSNLFAYCFFGKMATASYENMADCLFDCNWHELDIKLQKYIVIMMTNAQRPIYYHGFGVAMLNLETFLKMIRAVFTYYMLFKTLTSD